MALIFMDSFAHWTGAGVAQKWTGGGTTSLTTALDSLYPNHYNVYLDYRNWAATPVFAAAGTIMVHFRFYRNFNSGTMGMINLYSGTTCRGSLTISANTSPAGVITYSRDTNNALGSTSLGLAYQTWYDIQLKVYFHGTLGTVDLLVNGDSWLALTNQNTGSGYTTNCVNIGDRAAQTSGGGSNWADFVLWDTTGSYNNSWPIGDVRVECIRPNAAGSSTAWTRGGTDSGANWSQLDETTYNSDTDYVYSATAAQKDTYNFTSLTSASADVYAVQYNGVIRKDAAGSRSICPIWRPASTDYEGATFAVGDSYTIAREIKETSPETSTAWTVSEVNGAQFGIKMVG